MYAPETKSQVYQTIQNINEHVHFWGLTTLILAKE